MPAHTVKCPECRTTLKSSRPIPVGKLLTCPKCDVLFAAPKPVLDAEVVEEVEIVEDVDVIEDVEVLDDDAPPRKPARKPAAAAQRSRVNAGIEVVEDDEDDEPRPARKKAALRPKRKSGGGGAKVVMIVSAAVLGLALLGGAAWLAIWLLGGGGDEPLAYIPAESQVVVSADMNALWQTPVVPLLDPLLSNPQSPVAKLKSATNASTRDVCQRLVVGIRPTGGKTEMAVVLKSAADLDVDKLGKAFAGSKSSVGGRTAYKLPSGMGGALAVPNKHIAVFADMNDDAFGRVLKSSGKSSVLSGDLATLASKFGSSTIWVVGTMNDPSFKAGLQAGLAANPAAKGVADALQSAKGFALAINVAGSQVEVKVAALCPDAGAAQNVVTQMQQSAEKSKNDAMSKAMMAMMPAAIKTLQEEAESSQQFTTDGSLAVMSFKFNMSTLESAVGAISQMAAAFGGGAGGLPGAAPMNPPGDQPKDKAKDRGSRGGGKGGRNKNKGGGG
jgi:hypothetical protein